jgi:hypothetical protein
MENKQDRKLASLKKDPDEDVGSNHDRKPAPLQKDPDEDVVTLNNHYDSTDMEEEDDYDELDELPLQNEELTKEKRKPGTYGLANTGLSSERGQRAWKDIQ